MHSLISPSIVWLISILMAVGFAGMQVKDRDGTQSVLRRCNERCNKGHRFHEAAMCVKKHFA